MKTAKFTISHLGSTIPGWRGERTIIRTKAATLLGAKTAAASAALELWCDSSGGKLLLFAADAEAGADPIATATRRDHRARWRWLTW